MGGDSRISSRNTSELTFGGGWKERAETRRTAETRAKAWTLTLSRLISPGPAFIAFPTSSCTMTTMVLGLSFACRKWRRTGEVM